MAYPWKNMNLIPMAGLEAWHMYEPAVSGHNVIYDYSGKGRDISCGAGNAPVLTSNVFNGQPGWYFNGSRDPLTWSGSSFTAKHLFIICSAEDAAFSTIERGLYSGVTSGDFLTANATGDKFYEFSPTSYRKADVSYGTNDRKAPMSNAVAVIETSFTGGQLMDGIQVGKQRDLAGRNWKGHYFESLLYSDIKNDLERLKIYRYAAMRYWLWQKTSAGLDVYPFPSNKSRSSARDQEHYSSEPYSGDPTTLVRGSMRRAFSLPHTNRLQAEFEAAEQFHSTHRHNTDFVYRDYRFYPPRDSTVWLTSDLREQGSDVLFRFNYSFDVVETS